MKDDDLTQKIIGCAYTVHNTLGPGRGDLSGIKYLGRINRINKILKSKQGFKTWPHKFASR
jgi:hypothetical protein